MTKDDMISAGLSEKQIRLLHCPFVNLSKEERNDAFKASDKVAAFNRKQPYRQTNSLVICDRDKLLKDGVSSPVDGKKYTTRREWNDMLKRHNCVELGNDKLPKRELQGNFNCRKELTQATHQVLEKHGLR